MAAEALIVEDAYQRGYADAMADMRKKKEQRRQREQAKKARRWYFIKQKAYGLAMLAVTVLAAWATEGDITIAVITVPLGLMCLFSKKNADSTLTPEEYASWNGWHKVKGKMKKAYRNGSFVMNQSTFDTGIDGMEDKNGQPIGRTNYGVNGEETYRFMGKNVETVEDDVLPSWDDANEGDVIAVFMNFSDYVINTNMEMQVVKWTDHDNNKIKNKCLMVVDGKVADAAGIILVKKGVTAV